MLVLSRKTNQKIRIGEDIEITVVAVSGDNVKLGITAPSHVKILRSEVYEEISKENNNAVQNPDDALNLQILIDTLKKTKKNIV